VVVTDVVRDGQMTGSNRELLARVADATDARIIASGGVNSLSDIEALRDLGIDGAIVGKALYQGAFSLEDALVVAGYEEC
jgi:1-(5-phosphoribosyl)-5-[(5-phosphoribosylamino)methylideneamino] imidazole-4-carboxamide isomerase